MKQLLLPLLLLALTGPAAAQRTELIGRAGLGLLRFSGPDAATVSAASYFNEYFGDSPGGQVYAPYGRKMGAGFAVGGRVQRVGPRQGLVALDLSYDWLQSRVDVNRIDYSSSLFSSFIARYKADGKVNLRSQHLTAFVGLGHRFKVGAVDLDVLAGPEVAYVFGIEQKGTGTYDNGTTWTLQEQDAGNDQVDAGLRADATAWFQKVGFTTSYSHGVINYQAGLTGSNPRVYSRIWRLGVAYRLK